ncbi:DNA mismatch repair endonuclease MutL [Terribacillus saccharophilus]|uniref:DNA mismatch repair protein MutL n=1 Tax=Terribacillus saccharophilus TaxID=361277 RepID=A0ABX4H379_9BACI|nr:DNA mismatch repair endonuclease MutL [Terribacillus saccharophilus]PAD37079.1 DNA mismatch repair endonuclease MutL [Terribacillus saccharophilus]PAD97556.1 DNA mismatch repair endonuclease MutL [Terribacillus saccharophilus]PAE01603.1 DNA mismatch repair endonuclease MutL [Terribacillus saccharophilus]
MAIQLMPDDLANKIAAGEVVERPASVVKELVENSIDAGSTVIKVAVQEAGLTEIKIVDNGDGMESDDVERAFFRHATSKIRNEHDLFHVRTLGFRGEALASIAAVSQLEIKTSTGENAGVKLVMAGGSIKERGKCDARKGTEMTVRHLFFNTPARLKYMKTIHTELGHVSEVINRLSLAHPEIRFELTHNDKPMFQSSGRGDMLQIAAQIYGNSVAKKMVKASHETLDYKLEVFAAKPEINRASRQYVSFIVNGRYIRNPVLAKAVMQAYHTLLPIGRFPLAVITIEMDPVLVDVNVHPAKLEVRFSKEKELFDAVEQLVSKALRQQRLIPEAVAPKQKKIQEKSEQQSFSFFESKPAKEPEVQQEQWFFDKVKETAPPIIEEKQPDTEPEIINDSSFEIVQEPEYVSTEKENEPEYAVPAMYPIGQHHGTYILAENEEGLFLIDQHAAQERIKYEYYREKIGEVEKELQELLIPLTFDFTQQESLIVEQHKTELEAVGLFFESFGGHTYIVRSHPQWFPKGFEEEIIREIVEQVMQESKVDIRKLREEAAIMMSCKRSIKANHHLNYDDMFHLLEELRTSQDPFTCPHGRPIIIRFTSYELEKLFKRVQ